MTYSILGYDASNGDLGVAVQSKFPGVGSLVPYGEAEVGVVATQGFGNPRHGSAGLMLLRCGATPQQAVDVLLNDDVSATSGSSHWSTGKALSPLTPEPTCIRWDGWSGSATGHGCVALGNGLAGNDVVEHMVRTFEELSRNTRRTIDDGAGLGRTSRRRHTGPAIRRLVGGAAQRRLRGARRPPRRDLHL